MSNQFKGKKKAGQETTRDIFKFQNLHLLDKIFERDELNLTYNDLYKSVARVFASDNLIQEFIENLEKHWCLFSKDGKNEIHIGYISHPEKNAMIKFDDYKKLENKEEWYNSSFITRKLPEHLR